MKLFKKAKALLFVASLVFGFSSLSASTFDFENATGHLTPTVTQTVDGVTLTITASDGSTIVSNELLKLALRDVI